jgi:hypothetical protein
MTTAQHQQSTISPVSILQRQEEAAARGEAGMPRIVFVGEDEFADISDWAGLTTSCPCIYAPGSDKGRPPEFCKGARSLSPPLCGTAWARHVVVKTATKHQPALRSGGAVIHYIGPDPHNADTTAIEIYDLPGHGGCWDDDDCREDNPHCVDKSARKYLALWPQKYNIHERLGIEFGKLTCAEIARVDGCPTLEAADLTHLCTCSCTFLTTERTAQWMAMRQKRSMSVTGQKGFARRRPRHHPDQRRAGTQVRRGGDYDADDDEDMFV